MVYSLKSCRSKSSLIERARNNDSTIKLQVFWLRGENLLLRFLQLQLRHQSLVRNCLFHFSTDGKCVWFLSPSQEYSAADSFSKKWKLCDLLSLLDLDNCHRYILENFYLIINISYHRYLKTFILTLIFCGQPHKPDKLIPTNVSKVQALYLSIYHFQNNENPL